MAPPEALKRWLWIWMQSPPMGPRCLLDLINFCNPLPPFLKRCSDLGRGKTKREEGGGGLEVGGGVGGVTEIREYEVLLGTSG